MKMKCLTIGFLSALIMLRAGAQEEQLSLPPDFALAKAPAFSQWKVTFSFTEDTAAATGGGASPAANATDGKNAPLHPKQLTVTRTAPIWHAVLVMTNGNIMECWGDGHWAYMVPTPTSAAIALSPHGSTGRYDMGGYSELICDYNQFDYPDLDWISPQTYVGSRKGVFIFREKNANGATATIAADARTPVTWTNGFETRVFRFLPPPADKLVFPEGIGKISADLKRLHDINSSSVPQTDLLSPPAQ
jgi:hypothetical protein